MKNNPFFSIIIPTLNEEKYLPNILKSLSKQTFRDFELIVVDSNSVDRTVDVFNKFKLLMPLARIILSDKRNVGYQRNLGTKSAKGKYLVFLDADCNVGITFLEELHVAAIKQKFPFATTWIKPDSKKQIDNVTHLLANLTQELAKAAGRQYAGGYNTIVTKKFFEKQKGFREDLLINEDCDFALRAQKKRVEVAILREPQVIYSLRRLRSEGTLPLLRKYAYAQIYNLLKGPITTALFDYPMGGHVHKVRRKKKINLAKLNSYLETIRKFEKKISKLLEE